MNIKDNPKRQKLASNERSVRQEERRGGPRPIPSIFSTLGKNKWRPVHQMGKYVKVLNLAQDIKWNTF